MGAIKGKGLKSVVCPKCGNFESKRLTVFEKHLIDVHDMTLKSLWDEMNSGPKRCGCGCGSETRWNGWWNGYSQVVNGHNAFIYSFCSPKVAEEISKKRSESLRGKESWSKGLTKETDERVRKRGESTSIGRKSSFEAGDIKAWNKGLTKKTDKRIADAGENLKSMFKSGAVVPWAKGLTKKTSEKIASMSTKISLTMRHENIRKRLDAMKRLSTDEIKLRIENLGMLRVVGGLENYTNDSQKIIEVECSGCKERFTGSLRSLQHGKCFRCSPGGSIAQEELAKWIESLGVNVKRNDRSVLDNGMELDIYVPSKGVAVEYNGLYWHSHMNRSPAYHSNKTYTASRMKIKLVHVFEDEWREKSDIVKSIIISCLGASTRNVGARKCELRQITSSERKKFFDENHLDGDTKSTIAWGLFFQGDIVYALSLRKPFHKRDSTMEVARCCPKIMHNVPGGLSRLVNASKKWCKESKIETLMTYVDTRIGGSGKGYIMAGFKESSRTPPRFWWTDFTDRFNRFKFKADSKNGLSEAAVAEEAGVVKIWGCENIVYELKTLD